MVIDIINFNDFEFMKDDEGYLFVLGVMLMFKYVVYFGWIILVNLWFVIVMFFLNIWFMRLFCINTVYMFDILICIYYDLFEKKFED